MRSAKNFVIKLLQLFRTFWKFEFYQILDKVGRYLLPKRFDFIFEKYCFFSFVSTLYGEATDFLFDCAFIVAT